MAVNGEKWKALNIGVSIEILKLCACGWSRAFSPRRKDLVFDHPVYGWVTGEEMARKDVETHRCNEHRAALVRRGERAFAQ